MILSSPAVRLTDVSQQIPLELSQPISFSPDNFVVHAGVSEVAHDIHGILEQKRFSLTVVLGEPRSGKTHFSVYLSDRAITLGRQVVAIEGALALEWCAHITADDMLPSQGVLLIDDADAFLSGIVAAKSSGPFVDLVERCRRRDVALVLLSSRDLEGVGCDDHVLSRLRAGIAIQIGHPGEDDLSAILDTMTKQRGVYLSESKRGFLLRRVERSVSGVLQCLDRLGEVATGPHSSSTSFQVLSGVVR
jgi:chromosomal replication initiation ATPase DnaA